MEDDDDILYHVPRVNEDVKNNLLFIHMTVVQKLLLQHYNNLVLMDATYHTCRLMLPFFFLAMKTNVNYSPIASFTVQNEDAKSILEALSRIKQYIGQDNRHPKFHDQLFAYGNAIHKRSISWLWALPL